MQSFLQPFIYFIKHTYISIFLIFKNWKCEEHFMSKYNVFTEGSGFPLKPSTGSLKSEATFQPGFLNHGGSPS